MNILINNTKPLQNIEFIIKHEYLTNINIIRLFIASKTQSYKRKRK